MTDRHRAAHQLAASTSHAAAQGVPPGRGPRGMWWVAWRQHRIQMLVTLTVLVLVALSVLLFQLVLVVRLHAAGCTVLTDPNACNDGLFPSAAGAFDEGTWHLLRAVLVATPIVLGVFVGAPIFPREFEQRTEVFALSQSVGRIRWWATKITVVGVPLVAALVGLGFLVQWCDAMTWYTGRNAFDDGTFQVRGIIPAAFGLAALAISVTVGILVRSIVGSVVAALIVAGSLVIIIGFPLRPHLLPSARDITPIADVTQFGNVAVTPEPPPDDPGALALRTGYLDAAGSEVPFDNTSCALPNPVAGATSRQAVIAATDAMRRAFIRCHEEHGITGQYTDYLPASMLWPLRGIVAGICVLLAALFLAAGAWRLRRLPRSVR